jgi:hypothetical protein
MAICKQCNSEMLEAATCVGREPVQIGSKTFPRIPYQYSHAVPDEGRCRDCGVTPGGIHHPYCVIERCPQCNGQLLSCGCSLGSGRLSGH